MHTCYPCSYAAPRATSNKAAYPRPPKNAPLDCRVINALEYMQHNATISSSYTTLLYRHLFLAACRALVLVAASLTVMARLFLTSLVNHAALSDAVVMAFPNHVGVRWQRQDALDGFPRRFY
jgi:hypothetical protein